MTLNIMSNTTGGGLGGKKGREAFKGGAHMGVTGSPDLAGHVRILP